MLYNGVGRITVFEDTIPELGYKQFGVFESSPSEILYCAHKFIEAGKMVLLSPVPVLFLV